MNIHTALQLHSEPHIHSFLKSKSSDINAKDICDQTPLHIACSQGMSDIVKILLKKKGDVNARDSKGWTPFHCAANEQKYDICQILITHKANLNETTQDHASVLAYCAKGQRDPEKQVKLIEMILAKIPALLDKANYRNETPLNRACISGSFEVVQCLIQKKADVNSQTV